MAAAFIPEVWMVSMGFLMGLSTGRSIKSSSGYPVIPARMLLRSWATPPASVPRASIFADRCRRTRSRFRSSSASIRSEMSLVMPSIWIGFPLSSRRKRAVISAQTVDPSLQYCSNSMVRDRSGSIPSIFSRDNSSEMTVAANSIDSGVRVSWSGIFIASAMVNPRIRFTAGLR